MKFERFVDKFAILLSEVNPDTISKDVYCIQYLKHIQQNAVYYLSIYANVFNYITEMRQQTPSKISLMDFGCGNGVAGLFAVYCGFKKVYLSDSDHTFIASANNLATILNLDAVIVHGSFEVIDFSDIDALMATDVIEHIYKTELLFQKIFSDNPDLKILLTTASNPYNVLQKTKIRKLQIQDEVYGNTAGQLLGHTHVSYQQMRADLIRKWYPGKEIEESLVSATRGLAGEDLKEAIRIYYSTGVLPVPASGTNTCHPVTGSWTERWLTTSEWKSLMDACGLQYDMLPGYYNTEALGVKKILKNALNRLISVTGLRYAPWIYIQASKK